MNKRTRARQLGVATVWVCLTTLGAGLGASAHAGETGKPVPEGSLFLAPANVSEVGERNSVPIHDYGPQRLVLIASPDSLSADARARITELADPTALSYRGWSGPARPLTEQAAAGMPFAYYLLALTGPTDKRWEAAFTGLGIAIVDVATPFALVVHADGSQLLRAGGVRTSLGYSVVRGFVPVPVEARLDADLLKVATGLRKIGDIPGLRKSADGRGVVRVFPYDDVEVSRLLADVRTFADASSPELAYGYDDAVLISGPELKTILANVAGVAHLEALHERQLHNNIAAQGPILGIEPVWSLGYTGSGVIVDHNDGGVNLTHPDFPTGVILATYGAMTATNNEHGTHTAGSVVGRGLAASSPLNTSGCGDVTAPLSSVRGMAWGAQLVTNNLFDGGYTTETAMMRWGYTQGARLSTNSWGYISDYNYDTYAATVDTLVRDASTNAGNQEFAILFSAGNSGSGASTVGSPGTAKNALTVGATQNDRCGSYVPGQQAGPSINTVTTFSSRGPSQGRIKPDVVAIGADVLSVDSLDCSGTVQDPCEEGWDQNWTGTYYRLMPGTSMSTPITAGATAVFFEFYSATHPGFLPSPALAKAAMINGAVNIGLGYPSYAQGWGRIDLLRSIQGPPGGSIVFVDQREITPLITAATWTKTFSVNNAGIPLKITLAWTDPPGASGCSSCLVNNLNLVVTSPTSTVYRGNQLTASWSTPGATGTDTVNNVENVFVQSPAEGSWTIQVTSANTATNPPGLTGQDFAIVYSGGLAPDCIAPPAPTGVAAAANGNNRIDVSWATVSGAAGYRVYRGPTSGGAKVLVGSVTAPTTSWADTEVQAGVTYYYIVRAISSGTPVCESLNSAEVHATATGICQLPPTFAGLATVTNPIDAACGLDLSWSAASSQCGGAVTYSVYRSTSPGFTPGLGNRIAAGLTGTTYADSSALASGSTYYYVVRATDEGNGVEDVNAVERSGTPIGPVVNQSLYGPQAFDALANGDLAGWGRGYYTGDANDWRGVQTCTAHSGTKIFRFGGTTCTGDYARNKHALAYPPPIAVPAASQNMRLSFWHGWAFEAGADGGYLRVSLDGSTFIVVTAAPILSGPYNGTVETRASWTGAQSTFVNTIVDLDAACDLIPGNSGGCAGKTVYIGFTAYTGGNPNADGWFIDDVHVYGDVPGSCSPAPQAVQFLTARSTSTANTLEWQNPANGAYGSAVVRYRTDGTFPTSATNGTAVTCSGQNTALSGYNACTHSGLANGTTYSYSVFVNNGSGVHSSRRTVAATPFDTSGARKWSFSTGAANLAPAGIRPGALGTGAVYEVSNDRVLHAMNTTAAGGTWPRTLPSYSWTPLSMNAPAQHRPGIAPLAAGSRAFLASQDGYAYAVDAATGAQVWMSPKLGDVLQANPAGLFSDFKAGAPNLVFVGTRNATSANKLYALDPATGAVVGTPFDNGGGSSAIGIITGITVDYATNYVYFTSRAAGVGSSHTLWCLNATGGTLAKVWSLAVGDVDGSPVLYEGRIYVGTNTGQVRAVDATTHLVVWTYPAAPGSDGPVKGYVTPDYGTTPLRLYYSTNETVWGLTLKLDGSGVDSFWSNAVPSNPSTPLLLFGTAHLLVGCGDGTLQQLNTATGAVVKSVSVGTAALGSPAMDSVNGLAHVGSTAGVLHTVTAPIP